MNKLMIAILSLVIMNAEAQVYSLDKLDVIKTCATREQKIVGEKSLALMDNFKWWKIKNILQSFHADYRQWHSSRVYLASITPLENIPNLPFKTGIFDKEGVLYDLAMIAYTNDVPKYTLDVKRVECVGHDTVIISTIFNGINVYRNEKGTALYQTPVRNASTRFTLQFKDGLIYRNIIDLADSATVEMMNRLRELIKAGVPNVEPGTIPDQTFEEIYQYFKEQAE